MQIKYPLLLDGGLSNVLEEQGCNLNHELWSAKLLETDPEAIIKAHLAYLNVGANCITTASYQASVPGFMALGHTRDTAENLIRLSTTLAIEAVRRYTETVSTGTRPLIAGSIGPYGAFLADGSEYSGNYGVSDDVLYDFHYDRIKILDQTNIALFACETIPSFQEAKVLAIILKETFKQAWISFSCKDEIHINDGTTIEECVNYLAHLQNILAIGVNCTAPKYISGLIKSIKVAGWGKRIVVYPNSGEAYNAKSKTWLGVSEPKLYVDMTNEWLELGADIVGGCCRIGPEHIRSIRDELHIR